MTEKSKLHDIFISHLPNLLLELENIDLSNYQDDLSEIISKYDSDKGYGLCRNFIERNQYPPNLVCHNYTFFYENLFRSIRNETIKIFEMGVGVPSCMFCWAGSLKGWEEYFPNSEIFSADFDKDYLYNEGRIKSYYVDQENEESIKGLWKNFSDPKFDFIVEDGPHTFTSQILFYKNSIDKVKEKGLYIIEDVHLKHIDMLYDEILLFNQQNNINAEVIKLIIPYPEKFIHISEDIRSQNNLIFVKLL